MTTAAVATVVLNIKRRSGAALIPFSGSDPEVFAKSLLLTVAVTTAVWVVVTFLTPPEPESKLLEFYRRVRPLPAGWKHIAAEAPEVQRSRDGWYNLMDWLLGCLMVYMALFGSGKIILGQAHVGLVFLGVSAGSAYLIYWDLSRRGWETLSGRG